MSEESVNYSKDIDHLVSFNKNGLWIKESLGAGQRIISSEAIDQEVLSHGTIRFAGDMTIKNTQ